jgi:hypothetical protein
MDMLKNATYKEKFVLLKPWHAVIIDAVKKDLKNEHLKQDFQFCKKYLPGKSAQKLTTEELVDVYGVAVEDAESGEALAEFISNRWLLKNSDLYGFFEQKLSEINPNFTEIEELDADQSRKMLSHAVKEFGAARTYLFSVINSVVFPEQVYRELDKQAKDALAHEEKEAQKQAELEAANDSKLNYEQQIARLTDKYEKKLVGMQKKYIQDTDTLKKQVATLQRKLQRP